MKTLKVVFKKVFQSGSDFFLMLRCSRKFSAETSVTKKVVLHLLSTRIFRKLFVNNNKQVSAIKNFQRGLAAEPSLGVIRLRFYYLLAFSYR